MRLFGRDPQAGVAALDGVAGFVEAPRFYPYLTGRRNLELCAALDGGGARGAHRRGRSTSSSCSDRAKDRVGGYSHGMRQRLGIAAALLRRPQAACCSTSRRPAWTPPACATCALLVRRLADDGMTVAALQPSARRGRGAVQPRRDRPPRAHRLRGRAGRPAPRGGRPSTACARPTTTARWRCAPAQRGHRRRRAGPARRHRLPRAVRAARSASCRSRWPRRARSILELAPQPRDARGPLLRAHRGRRRRRPSRRAGRDRERGMRPGVLAVYRWELQQAALPEAHLPRPRRRGARADHLRRSPWPRRTASPNDVAFGRYIH